MQEVQDRAHKLEASSMLPSHVILITKFGLVQCPEIQSLYSTYFTTRLIHWTCSL